MKKQIKLLLVSLSLLGSLSACQSTDANNTIYTSFYPIYDLTRRIVKDKFNVVNLTPAGSEPHDYEPTAKQVVGMTECKALFLNGLGLESWSDSLPDTLKEKTYTVSEGITPLSIDNVLDPHVWLSIPNAMKEMENILKAVSDLDPDNASFYKENYDQEVVKFKELDQRYRDTLGSIENKYLVVSHAAFGYLCKEYGFTQIYVSGLSPDQEPTPKALESIISQVREHNIKTIYYEELVSDDIAKLISSETGVKVDTLNPMEGLTDEELKSGEDYLSVMEENLKKIKEGS